MISSIGIINGEKPPRSERWPSAGPRPTRYIINARRFPGWTAVRKPDGGYARVWLSPKPRPEEGEQG